MNLRFRILTPEEVAEAEYDGWPMVMQLMRANHPDEFDYAVLEYQAYTSNIESSWEIVAVTRER